MTSGPERDPPIRIQLNEALAANIDLDPRCRFFVDQFVHCGKQVGYVRAQTECLNEHRDLLECRFGDVQRKRYFRMQEERIKKGLKFIDPPAPDIMPYIKYKEPTF